MNHFVTQLPASHLFFSPRQLLLTGAASLWTVLFSASTYSSEPLAEPADAVIPVAVEADVTPTPESAVDEFFEPLAAKRDIGPDPSALTVPLNLEDAITIALEENLGIKIARFSPLVARDDIEIARAPFDTTLSTGFRAEQRVSPQAATQLDGSARPESSNRTWSAGVNQRVRTGATVGLSTGINRFGSNSAFNLVNPDYTSDITLSARQPLLRGFGSTVNLAPIARAQSQLRQTEYSLRQVVLDVIAETEIRYWELAASRTRKEFRQTSLDLAESLVEETAERERFGLATAVDVLQAQAALALREEDVILAQQAIEDNEDRLRVLLGILNPFMEPSLMVAELPQIDPELPAFTTVLDSALASDLHTLIQYEIIEQNKIDRSVARNSRLPDLDVFATGSALGRTTSADQSMRNAVNRDGHRWTAGVEISLPWGFREGRARTRRAESQLRRSEIQLARIQQELVLQLRSAWRDVQASKQRVRSNIMSMQLNEESYQRERVRYENGLATIRSVLESQRDLDEARLRYIEAAFDLLRAVIRLERLDGTLLERHGFEWEEIDELGRSAPGRVSTLTPQNQSTEEIK